MPTLAQMRSSVRIGLRDSEAAYISDNQIDEWLNEAYLDLCARLSLLQTNVGGTTSATSTITLPADFIRIISLGLDSEVVSPPVIEPYYTTNEVFLSWVNGGDEPDSYIYRIYEGVIDIYPVIADRDYTMEYIKKPTALSSSDTPLIPEELHLRLKNYARAHAKLIMGEQSEAETYFTLYNQGLPGTEPLAHTRLYPGPFTIVPEPNYWED